jgi:hypothetical protein
MTVDIEQTDRMRMSYLRGFLVAFLIFLILWLMRFFMRWDSLNTTAIGALVLAGLIAAVAIQAFFMARLSILGRTIRKDPVLAQALNNEFVMRCELRSWKAAFVASACSTMGLALISFFHPVNDLVFVALTAIIVGAGAYRASFYILYSSNED